MKSLLFICCLLIGCFCMAQAPYAPAAGEQGSDAIPADSSIFKAWATNCSVKRGYLDISKPVDGKALVGDSTSAIGPPLSNGLVSLGDGGEATLQFGGFIYDGPGPDFAIFENGFTDVVSGGDFLELAVVEASSDGINFFRFPAHSLTPAIPQRGSFDTLNPAQLNNLAGKYHLGYGTPFDLADLAGIPQLDISKISHVRIIDVVGSIDPQFATYDTAGNIINDPYPTPFPSGGFDLDAVGVIHLQALGLKDNQLSKLSLYPNPCNEWLNVNSTMLNIEVELINSQGAKVGEAKGVNPRIDMEGLSSGFYILRIRHQAELRYFKVQKL